MNICVIIYHSNILSLYKEEWISECLTSISKQTYKNFYILELNYGKNTIQELQAC